MFNSVSVEFHSASCLTLGRPQGKNRVCSIRAQIPSSLAVWCGPITLHKGFSNLPTIQRNKLRTSSIKSFTRQSGRQVSQDGAYRGQTRKASVSGPVQSFHELSFTDLKEIKNLFVRCNFTKKTHENSRWEENLTLVRVIKSIKIQGQLWYMWRLFCPP